MTITKSWLPPASCVPKRSRPLRNVGSALLALLFAVAATGHVANAGETETAVFAGGCFWCMEEAFEKVNGVSEAISGYAGGHVENPGYRQVTSGRTGHAEVVKVDYDPEVVSYEELLQVFWLNIDPTVADRQFCDTGSQYRSAIFPADDQQRTLAEASLEAVRAQKPFAGSVHTRIEPLETFYPAEDYHQDYYRKSSIRYKSYKFACGRERRLDELWDDADRAFTLEGASR